MRLGRLTCGEMNQPLGLALLRGTSSAQSDALVRVSLLPGKSVEEERYRSPGEERIIGGVQIPPPTPPPP